MIMTLLAQKVIMTREDILVKYGTCKLPYVRVVVVPHVWKEKRNTKED